MNATVKKLFAAVLITTTCLFAAGCGSSSNSGASGDKKEIEEALVGFFYDTTDVVVPDHRGREQKRQFEEKLYHMVLMRLLGHFLLPVPLGTLYTIIRSVPTIHKGAKSLLHRKINVSVLDATAVTASLLRGDHRTAGATVFLLGIGDLLEDWTHKRSVDDLAQRMALRVESVWVKSSGTEVLVPVKNVRVGDTITLADRPAKEHLPGYKKVQPMVYCGIYPADGADYESLRDALEKLRLNDAALSYEPETSVALGYGFRCGFLGLLHMEIIQERLEREFDLDLVTTAPSVVYKVVKTDGTVQMIDNPTNLPPVQEIDWMEEPCVDAQVITPQDYVGAIMELCQDKRGTFKDMKYIEGNRVLLNYDLPLNEVIYDFFDQLKSRTRGYASFDYELKGYVRSDLVKLDMLLNGEQCDALSIIVHRDRAYPRGRSIAEKLKEAIPRQLFEIPIQAAIGGKVIARETVKALRKDVLAKCYGGDITRKKKLLEKQKEGKKRMRQVGSVAVHSEAFMAVLKMD